MARDRAAGGAAAWAIGRVGGGDRMAGFHARSTGYCGGLATAAAGLAAGGWYLAAAAAGDRMAGF
jgi:hypothetical protein